MSLAHIAFVEDDATIREFVAKKLVQNGYEVTSSASPEEFAPTPKKPLADLYILDVLIDGEPRGLELCETLRKNSPTVPILILSALGEASHRIEGLRTGADDYLAKPFEMEELLLRVSGMLRRQNWYDQLPGSEIYHWGKNTIDFKSFEGTHGTRSFALTQKECMLMKLLIEKKNEVVGRSEILDRVWGYDVYPSSRTVDNVIAKLRKYFEETPSQPKDILSVRGVGYKFSPEKNQ